MSYQIDQAVAVGLIKFNLSGFRGYPKDNAGINVFSRCLQECCVSVDHAIAVLKLFTDEFPTLRDIITAATNLRAKFEPDEDPRKKWEREYGPAVGTKVDFKSPVEPPYMERDRKIRAHIIEKRGGTFPGWAALGWLEIFEAQEACGYPLTREQEKMIGRK